ncbi:acyl-ACP thioesterase domain-containing protein [Clostridium sp. C8-1-8]|uniref:acyl-[acyl-carrier-protein] thioesterase n=1 Tax=Clostridium sp. C8-1-8 TaxID=2698831 RepID=UPI00136DF3B6|nr:acyl-ACP thioesterase domain-containing protein [Clostridium sp. C8-1-8]
MLSIEKEYEIHYYDVDINKKLTLTSLMNFLQDIFVYASESGGRGIQYMNNINLTWVVHKWEINMYDYPSYSESIKIRMTPTAYRKSYMNIRFEILDSYENIIADAYSLWILLDMKDRIPCRNKFEDVYKVYGLNYSDNKINIMKEIKTTSDLHDIKEFHVGYCDIDTNGHVNNVKYLSWILNSVSLDIMRYYTVKQISISYKKPASYNDVIRTSYTKENDEQFIRCTHKIVSDDEIVLVLAETLWQITTTKEIETTSQEYSKLML